MKTESMIFGTNNRLNQLDKSPVTTPCTLCFHNFEIKKVKNTINSGRNTKWDGTRKIQLTICVFWQHTWLP